MTYITYIFDEPTSGLHPEDAKRIGNILTGLRNLHNTVLVVEHNRDIIELADEVIELGPLAGARGGQLVFQGSTQILREADTVTAKSLRQKIVVNTSPRMWNDYYPIRHLTLHNLRDVSVDIPKGVLTAVTGVAGSGKSSLIRYGFAEQYPQAIAISQEPIGISSRSNPATYTGAMDEIRKVFATENHVSAQWFSFNSKGACPICKGKGEITPDVAFADPVSILCEECGGHRYNKTALGYMYHGKNIESVMRLTITESIQFFPQKKIQVVLQTLEDVGLGYISLGQPTSTMSGGEIQRLKLASEIHKSGNIYVLDEPSVGMHEHDIENLLRLLNHLVAQGNTVVMIEHRPQLIAAADWIIDMGPGGGNSGGNILFAGTPENLLPCQNSLTASHLCRYSDKR